MGPKEERLAIKYLSLLSAQCRKTVNEIYSRATLFAHFGNKRGDERRSIVNVDALNSVQRSVLNGTANAGAAHTRGPQQTWQEALREASVRIVLCRSSSSPAADVALQFLVHRLTCRLGNASMGATLEGSLYCLENQSRTLTPRGSARV